MTIIKKIEKKLNPETSFAEKDQILKDFEMLKSQAEDLGIDTSKAEELLEEAKTAFSIKSEKSGKALANKAKREIRKKINSRDKARIRVMLSNKTVDHYQEKVDFAKKEYDFTPEESQGLELLNKADEKKSEGDYASAEALAWKGKKMLEEEIKSKKFRDSCNMMLESISNLYDYLSKYDSSFDDIEDDLKRAKEAFEEENFEECLSLGSKLFLSLLESLRSLKTSDFLEDFENLNHLEEVYKKLQNNVRRIDEEIVGSETIENLKTDINNIQDEIKHIKSLKKEYHALKKEQEDMHEKIEVIREKYVDSEAIQNLENELLDGRNRIRDLESLKEKFRDLEMQIEKMENTTLQKKDIEEMKSQSKTLGEGGIDKYINFEIEKIKEKCDHLENQEGVELELDEAKEKLDLFKRKLQEKEEEYFLTNLSRIANIETLIDGALLTEVKIKQDEIQNQIDDILSIPKEVPKRPTTVEKEREDESEILEIFNTSPRIETERLDLESDFVVITHPNFPLYDFSWIEEVPSIINWIDYSEEDISILLKGLITFDEVIGIDMIILLNSFDFEIEEELILFSGLGREKEEWHKLLPSQVREKSYIDRSKGVQSPLYERLVANTGGMVIDITLNRKAKGSNGVYEKLIEKLIE